MRGAAAALAATLLAGCSGNPRASLPPAAKHPDAATVVHLLNRAGFGPRGGDAGDVARVQQMGVGAYIDRQLHPETIADSDLEWRLQPLATRHTTARAFADQYYQPMVAARAR